MPVCRGAEFELGQVYLEVLGWVFAQVGLVESAYDQVWSFYLDEECLDVRQGNGIQC